MNKDELLKEAKERAKKRMKGFACQGNCENSYVIGALDFAESREKQIEGFKDMLEKAETERIQLIAKLAFTENLLNNCRAKNEKVVELITKLSQLKHHTDDCFTYDEYLKLIKETKQFLKNEVGEIEEKSNNLRYENDESPVSPSSIETNQYIHCDENGDEKQPSWTLYYTQDEELKNNLKSVVKSSMTIDEKIDLILALYRQIPTENLNPYNQPKILY